MGENYRNGVFCVFKESASTIWSYFFHSGQYSAVSVSTIFSGKYFESFNDCRIKCEVFSFVILIKINNLRFCSMKYVFGRPSRCFRFPSVVHGYLYSEVHGFFRRVSRFWHFHFHRWPPVVHRWPWRIVAPGIGGPPVVHQSFIVGSALDHRLPTVGSHRVSIRVVGSKCRYDEVQNATQGWTNEISKM